MKSFTIFATIAATVSAESGYTCMMGSSNGWSDVGAGYLDDFKTVEACESKCTEYATMESQSWMDYCCSFSEYYDPYGPEYDSQLCTLLGKESVPDDVANVKVAISNTETTSFYAWAWNQGVAMSEMGTSEDYTTYDAKDETND